MRSERKLFETQEAFGGVAAAVWFVKEDYVAAKGRFSDFDAP